MVSPCMSDFLMSVPDDQGRDVVILGQDSWMLCVFWQGCPVLSSTNPENPILEEGIQFHDRTTSLDLFTFLQSAKLLKEVSKFNMAIARKRQRPYLVQILNQMRYKL